MREQGSVDIGQLRVRFASVCASGKNVGKAPLQRRKCVLEHQEPFLSLCEIMHSNEHLAQ